MNDETKATRVEVPPKAFGSRNESFGLATARDILNGCTCPGTMTSVQRADQIIASMAGITARPPRLEPPRPATWFATGFSCLLGEHEIRHETLERLCMLL